MDPVLLHPLLDTIDLLAAKAMPLSIEDLAVEKKVTQKRFREIGRILESLNIAARSNTHFVPTNELASFVEAWDNADLLMLNQMLCRYPPYQRFMDYLSREKSITVPPSRDKAGREAAIDHLRNKNIQLTFVALDTFKWWGLGTGHVYVSHIGDRNIYWGGEEIDIGQFEEKLVDRYSSIKPADGYVNIGKLADLVCRTLFISFVTFEKLFAKLCVSFPSKYLTSTSLVRLPTTRSPVQTILSRRDAKERAKISGTDSNVEWVEKRYMEDGVFIGTGRKNVKLVRIRQENAL